MKPILRTALLCITTVLLWTTLGCQSAKTSAASKDAAPSAAPKDSDTSTASKDSGPSVTTGSSAAIDLVKNGILSQHKSTTVGKALEGTLKDGKWKSFETAKGQLIVEFDGTTTYPEIHKGGFSPSTELYEFYKKACDSTYSSPDGDFEKWQVCKNATPIPITFQFLVSTERTDFSVGAISHIGAFGNAQADQIFEFVYQ